MARPGVRISREAKLFKHQSVVSTSMFASISALASIEICSDPTAFAIEVEETPKQLKE